MAKEKKSWNVVVLPGDGIGPDVINAALQVINAINRRFGVKMDITHAEAGTNCIPKYGTNLPEKTIETLRKSDCVIKGPMATPEGKSSEMSAAVKMRKLFSLYANVRPSKNMPGVPGIKPNVDLVIVRENTEGLYSGLDFAISEDTAIGIRVITKKASERVGRFALELARSRKKHLTIVHKGNILKASDGLFKDTIMNVAKDYKEIIVDEAHVDAMAQWLIKNPEKYDVIVTENLFGDILSDEAAMVVGSLGVAPSANIGDSYAMFEPIHGSADKYAGKDVVNPIATILSVKMMYDWMGEHKAAEAIEQAVFASLKNKVCTYDLGGADKTSEVGKYIADNI